MSDAACEASPRSLRKVVELLDRFQELRDVGREDRQLADRELSAQHEQRARARHQGEREPLCDL